MFKHRTIAFGFAALLIFVFAAFAFAQPAGEKATLVVSTGQATVTHTESMLLVIPRQVETTLASGSTAVVAQGDMITLSDTATAQLHLFDGSTVDLYEGTTLELAELYSSETSHRVELYLLAGRTVNRVVKLLGADDAYELRTPSSTASVRGTVFTVEAISAKETYVAVAEGLVQVAMADQQVDVRPGESVTAVVGQPLSVEPNTNAPTTTQPVEVLNTATPTPTSTSTNTSTPMVTSTIISTATITPTITIAPTVTVPTPTNTSPPATNTPVPAPTGTLPPAATETPSDSVTICHLPPGNPANAQTIVVGASAVNAHLAHGDYLGPCQQPPAATETPAPVPTAVPPTAVPPTAVPPTEVPPTPEPPDVTLCHIPPGNPNNPQTIVVEAGDVAAHLAHGDYLGPCQ